MVRGELPKWVDIGLIPLINLAIALVVAGLVVVNVPPTIEISNNHNALFVMVIIE